ncbi:glycogen synthase [Ectothiorhodospira haloalkaliphila]|uniref:Glycogen synthase n=1 Tax=Ectothiorhodospira haloalkaliphila TaxID=421628 RepID=W8KN33_9GAMM|nr:glycogen synthase GlgA [Ectothiorhodospira haloalkaliphila]AHK78427.1 glycogen synthase [Ectothiorhodospira haloalkaliphila]
MRILFASSEAHPLIKTGGLADVCGSLPPALKRLRHDVRLVLPAYPAAVAAAGKTSPVAELQLPGSDAPVRILEGVLPKTRVKLYLVDSPLHFDRAGDPYRASDGRDWQDNHLRFGVFARALVKLAMNQAGLDWQPQILHCNDWQTGLAPALLSQHPDRPATVFTIHNLSYQGLFPRHAMEDLTLPPEFWDLFGLEYHGQLSFIKGGLVFADHLTTVSPTYAREIQTAQFGNGLDGLLNARAHDLTGIINGADYRHWDPAKDKLLPARYNADDMSGKATCKQALQERMGLEVLPDRPLLTHVGRMVAQKGVDLILAACEPLLAAGQIQLAILGSGDKNLEARARAMAARHPGRMGLQIGYDEGLAHQLEAGGDMFLMPSRFEPCGLNQMYSLRYGTVPLVRRTGGLADTVVDTNAETLAEGTATGLVFEAPTIEALSEAIGRGISLYQDQAQWNDLMRRGMSQEFSWDRSAQAYQELYRELTR